MLQYLKIKNLALMDAVELEFESGFNVVTGETGAGKSVLLGALAILAGNRISKTVVRKGTEQCEIEAIINLPNAEKTQRFLESAGLPLCEEQQLVLRRTVHVTKPGRITINGALATLAQLAECGETWIDFHGPGEPQKLFHENHQLEILDLFAGNADKLKAFALLYHNWKAALSEIEAIQTGERMSEEEIAFAQNQLNSMNTIELSDDAIDALENDFKKLSHAQELENLLANIDTALGDEGLAGSFPQLLKISSEIEQILPNTKALTDRINSLAIEMEDLREEYSALANSEDFTPEMIAELSQKMNLWLELKRKYGPTPENVRNKRDSLSLRLERQQDIEGSLERAYQKANSLEKELRQQANELHQARSSAANSLSKAAQAQLQELGFKKAEFKISLVQNPEIHETGTTSCRFMFSANAGQDLLPLNKIASAGETARVMLALKTVLAKIDATPVLVFDEVDANVGGEIAVHVAKKLKEVSSSHQVFCITHLAQVAAHGKHHFCVSKSQNETETQVKIEALTKNLRETELARMLGDRNSKAAQEHAKELLASI